MNVTLIVPFYRNCAMLLRQVEEWNAYPAGVRVIVVDDGSPEPALPILMDAASAELRTRLQLYRIHVDIPWNREGARNLGAHMTQTPWLIHVDIDHLLPAPAAEWLLKYSPTAGRWYRFSRWRKGRADETRLKDSIPSHVEFGQIHPHIDSYMVEREVYWRVGGYDEDYAGVLGGGTAFLRRLEAIATLDLLPLPVCLHVYTRSEIKDASDWSLSRDRSQGKKRTQLKKAAGDEQPKNPLRFQWSRQL